MTSRLLGVNIIAGWLRTLVNVQSPGTPSPSLTHEPHRLRKHVTLKVVIFRLFPEKKKDGPPPPPTTRPWGRHIKMSFSQQEMSTSFLLPGPNNSFGHLSGVSHDRDVSGCSLSMDESKGYPIQGGASLRLSTTGPQIQNESLENIRRLWVTKECRNHKKVQVWASRDFPMKEH